MNAYLKFLKFITGHEDLSTVSSFLMETDVVKLSGI